MKMPIEEPRLPAGCRLKEPNICRFSTFPVAPEMFQMSSVASRWVQGDYTEMMVSYSLLHICE